MELVATRPPAAGRFRSAVLYVHGWNDYFFQTHLADHLADLGFDFYALDLRRYGRSLRRGHLNGFITDLDDYALELDAAADLIAEDHDELLLMGHSTGGLITSLWAASNRDRSPDSCSTLPGWTCRVRRSSAPRHAGDRRVVAGT